MPLARISHHTGQGDARRQVLCRRVAANLAENPGFRPWDVLICRFENGLADGFSDNGGAQHAR